MDDITKPNAESDALLRRSAGGDGGVASVRIDLINGKLIAPHAGVAIVPLEDWAKLKHVLYERWQGGNVPCALGDTPCSRRLAEIYFHGLQDYLFPQGSTHLGNEL